MTGFCISLFYHLVRLFEKNKIYHKMQREKFYNLYKTSYFIIELFLFTMDKTLSKQILTMRKLIAEIVSFFSKQLQ